MENNNSRFSKVDYALMVIIAFCIVMLVFSSCKSAKVVYVPVVKDSTRVEIREKVVTVHDTAYLEVPAQSQQTTTRDSSSHLETDFAVSDARINSDGSLSHSLENKPQQEIPYEKEIVYVNKDSTVYVEKPVPYEVEKKLSTWQQMKIDYGGKAMVAFALFLFGWLAYLIIKFRRKQHL